MSLGLKYKNVTFIIKIHDFEFFWRNFFFWCMLSLRKFCLSYVKNNNSGSICKFLKLFFNIFTLWVFYNSRFLLRIGVTTRYRLSWMTTNSALVYEPKCGGGGGVPGSQPMSTALHRSPNKL
jgi:hypothetical protein